MRLIYHCLANITAALSHIYLFDSSSDLISVFSSFGAWLAFSLILFHAYETLFVYAFRSFRAFFSEDMVMISAVYLVLLHFAFILSPYLEMGLTAFYLFLLYRNRHELI